ncbi:MAG: proline--tRNA ligase [Ignavibacteria bacterium]|nr:proline--tRNA ligase [Bacteroidota bacterium]MSQ45600.1 proline--tRNA ligase [Ignavibacteria bacterium]
MRFSNSFIPTIKEVPNDAVIPSHQLMIRTGMVKALGSGIYSVLPFGLKVFQKVMNIIREEMNAIGGQEFYLPGINPVELWQETGRVESFGDIMFHIKNRQLILAPTHEEVITSIAKAHIRSYKELPQIWYQIQSKFRNEPRPKSGVIRSRQFTMKDSYSLDSTSEGLDKSYNLHAEAYKKIYTRSGLKFFIIGASSGAMGGSGSQEFMIESDAGEDTIILCESCDYAANLEIATSNKSKINFGSAKKTEKIFTPNIKTIDQLSDYLKVPVEQCAKSVVYISGKQAYLIMMVGNDQVNESKLKSVIGTEFRPCTDEELVELFGAEAGSLGPVGVSKNIKVIADNRLKDSTNLITGANLNDYHLLNVDLLRDCKIDHYSDLRQVEKDEPCSVCNKQLRLTTGIEVGHIFKLGTKYSTALKANFLDENGKENPIIMGSYGIGVERIAACYIEQNHDEFGIIWNKALSPFDFHLIAVNVKSAKVVEVADNLYKSLSEKYSILYDDRSSVSAGVKFKDADLLGMPFQIIVGERNLENNSVEIKIRRTNERIIVPIDSVLEKIKNIYE